MVRLNSSRSAIHASRRRTPRPRARFLAALEGLCKDRTNVFIHGPPFADGTVPPFSRSSDNPANGSIVSSHFAAAMIGFFSMFGKIR
jgi:hypothetical protein